MGRSAKLQGWKWLASVLLVFSVLIVPRVTVGVVGKTEGSAVKVVTNVPFGVAFLGSVTSTVGHTLSTRRTEAARASNPPTLYTTLPTADDSVVRITDPIADPG